MIVHVAEERSTSLREYARIPIAFEVREILEVGESASSRGSNRVVLTPRPFEAPYVKDYDVDGGPEAWEARFDLSQWRFFVARVSGERVGGAAVVFRAPGMDMLRDRTDVAILWDIRVAPTARRHGVGAALMGSVEAWSAAHGARWLEVETQNINVSRMPILRATGLRAVRGQSASVPYSAE